MGQPSEADAKKYALSLCKDKTNVLKINATNTYGNRWRVNVFKQQQPGSITGAESFLLRYEDGTFTVVA